MCSLIEDVDLQLMTFNDFGKEVLKMFKLSPDGFIQMAIQLAYYKYADMAKHDKLVIHDIVK